MRGLDTAYMLDLIPVIASYVPLTLFMAIVAMIAGLALAIVMAVIRVIFLYKIRNPRTADLLPDHLQLLW